jgi:hypothetical protein
MLLAIIELVCLEARVKFKNIDFQTKADFAYYYTILKGYALIFKDLLPRSLNVFKGTRTEDRASKADFLDLNVYSDLDHMPIALRRTITGSL